MSGFIDEINEYVDKNGVGAHFEYYETAKQHRKVKDEAGEITPIFDNRDVFFKVYDLLLDHMKNFISISRYAEQLDESGDEHYMVMDSYPDLLLKIIPDYRKDYGKRFTSYFIDRLNHAYDDLYNKDRIKNEKNSEGKDNNKEVYKTRKFVDYYVKDDDGEMVERKGLGKPDEFYDDRECIEKALDLSLQIIKLNKSISCKREAFKRMSVIFFTDAVVSLADGEKTPRNLNIRHSDEVFENLDKGLLQYIKEGQINNLADINICFTKTIKMIYACMDQLTEKKVILEEYKSCFKEDDDFSKFIKIPMKTSTIRAYLFYDDYKSGKEPHLRFDSAISREREDYRNLVLACLSEESFNSDIVKGYLKKMEQKEETKRQNANKVNE